MSTVSQLINYLSQFPEDTEVLIAGSSLEKNEPINGFFSTMNAQGEVVAPLVLSAHYYTTNEYA